MIDTMTLEPPILQQENRRRIAMLLTGFVVLSAVEGLVIGLAVRVPWLFIPVVALAGLYLLIGARLGDKWMLHILGARDDAPPRLQNLLQGVCEAASTPVPRLLVCPGAAPNTLALGLLRRTLVVTAGTLSLRDLEQEALLAHEAAHLRGGDAALASVYVLLAGAVELGTKALGASGGILALLALPVWPACLAVRALGGRVAHPERETRADVAGALLTRYPPGMRRALKAAAVEQADSTLRATDAFWAAPRVPGGAAALDGRAAKIAEM